jgi:hypothetical protein
LHKSWDDWTFPRRYSIGMVSWITTDTTTPEDLLIRLYIAFSDGSLHRREGEAAKERCASSVLRLCVPERRTLTSRFAILAVLLETLRR